MRTFPYLLAAAFLLLTPLSCDVASSLVHDDQPVAKVGREKLYRSEVESMIPDMISPEDSAGIAEKYIRLWAMDRLYMKVAEEQLSKSEIDVSDELESYRRSLVRYRYEQRYLNDRLDTLITDAQIREYYLANQEDFELSRPLLKLRFVDVMKDSPDKDEILRLMSSDEYDELELADSLAGKSALRYFDNSDSWMDAGELSRLNLLSPPVHHLISAWFAKSLLQLKTKRFAIVKNSRRHRGFQSQRFRDCRKVSNRNIRLKSRTEITNPEFTWLSVLCIHADFDIANVFSVRRRDFDCHTPPLTAGERVFMIFTPGHYKRILDIFRPIRFCIK